MARLTAIYEQRGQWWLGFIEELPGANSQGQTLDEARENLYKAAHHIVRKNSDYLRKETEGKSIIREEMFVDPDTEGEGA